MLITAINHYCRIVVHRRFKGNGVWLNDIVGTDLKEVVHEGRACDVGNQPKSFHRVDLFNVLL